MSGSARSHRRTEPIVPLQTRRKTHKVRHCLLSCCLFFAVLSACLIAALVLVGKHYYKNDPSNPRATQPRHEVLRLPHHTVPKSYDIVLRPNLTTGAYQGVVNISIEIVGATGDVVLHSKGLQIKQVELYNVNNSKVEVRDVKENALDEIITVSARDELLPDEYFLVISFAGSLLNRTNGFYRSQYVDKETKTKRSIATSKFEPTHARKAFPCFDEPNMKAKFTIHLLKPKDSAYISLSNMPEVSETVEEDGIMVHFQESVSMSTYLACFIVSDFTASKDTIVSDIGNIPFRVFASPGQLSKTEYARDTGKKIMEFYLKYFNIPYPLPKLDMVAIPDFSSGAMEHWGLVTYRETALLYGQNISSSVNKQRVATVVAHELAHSWFGNLVTMDWWNDLWLNEGFASYIEYKGVNAAEPDWHMMSQFLVEDMHSVLKLDATLASHPIVQTVETPDQIVEIFDTISYNKGASVLRMLEAAVGVNVFQQGVTNYLNNNKYGNAVTQDLLNELQALKKDFNVTEFMATWTLQMGYPIVSVKKIDGGFRLTQKRYLTDPNLENSYPTVEPYNYRWTIPITYISNKSSEPTLVWFDHKDEHVDIKLDVEWIKFNHDQVGYYRVNYAPDDWNKLISMYSEFGVSDRTHLLEESFRIAESGQLDYSVPLELTKQLKNETDYVPWDAASTVLKQIKTHMTTSGEITKIKDYIIKLLKPAYKELSWEELPEDPHLLRRARTTVISLACSADDKDALDRARVKFQKWLSEEEVLSQDLKTIVYTYGMVSATKDEWEKVLKLFLAEQDAGEKIRLLGGLTNVNNINLLQRLIELSKDESYVRRQDYFTCIRSISSNPAGTSLVWDYVRENWPMLVEMFGLNDSHLGGMIPHITKTFATKTKKDEIEAFFEKYPDAGAGVQSRKQALETVENNINWQAKNKEVIEKWIGKNQDFV